MDVETSEPGQSAHSRRDTPGKAGDCNDVRRQLVGELLLMASLAMAAGAVVVAHFPALHAVDWLSAQTYLAGFAISVAAIYFLVVVCGSYPARLATRIQPFEALRYE